MYYFKEDIYRDLELVNTKLIEKHAFLNLRVVGGSAFLFNGLRTVETSDIDSIIKLEAEIREILDDCGIDINDSASEYDYSEYEFITDDATFSNIYIEYLTIGGVIKSKLQYDDEEKAEALRFTMEDELEIEMTISGIQKYLLDEFDIFASEEEIAFFLNTINYI